VSPILIEVVGRVIPLNVVAIFFGISLLGVVAWLAADRRSLRIPVNRQTVLLGIFLLIGGAVVIGELIDIQRGNGLYLSVTALDQAYRVAFTNAIAHTGIPPLNPLYHPGASAPLRYYYFWYAVCAVCMKLAHVSARQALIGSSVWVGLGLTAMIALFARHFLAIRDGLYRYILAAALLLAVTGLDILPVLFNLIVDHDFRGDLEWWSTDQVASWLDSILWVPNHLGSMLSCMAAFLLLWRSREGLSPGQRIAATLLAGAAVASAFGLSVYVAVGFGILMAGWSLSLLVRERDFAAVARNCGAAATAGFRMLPPRGDGPAPPPGPAGRPPATPAHMFAFSVREMIAADLVTGLPVFADLKRVHPFALDQIARLVLLLPGYALELGVFGLVLVLAIIARKRLDVPRRSALALALGGLIIVSFMRSSVIGNNDFGYRAALLPCFFLLLLAADWIVSAEPGGVAPLFWILLVVGLSGTGFQALMLRIFVPLHVSAGMPGFADLPPRAYAARREYDSLAVAIPNRAIVQPNLINPGDYFYVANMLYSENAMASDAGVDCGAVFGGDPALCVATQQAIRKLYSVPAVPTVNVVAECHRLGIDYLVINSGDPAWQDHNSWVWTLPDVDTTHENDPNSGSDENASFRAVNCAGNATEKH